MTTAEVFHRFWKSLPLGQLEDVVGTGTCEVDPIRWTGIGLS